LSFSTRWASVSTSTTRRPASAKTCASGTPTYPAPTIATSYVVVADRPPPLVSVVVSGPLTKAKS
jgi:hypothetical protein